MSFSEKRLETEVDTNDNFDALCPVGLFAGSQVE